MLETLAWIALLLAGSPAQDAFRAGASASPKTQPAQHEKQSDATTMATFRITGRVVNSMTSAPVAGAYVVIAAASSSNLNRTVRAGADGSFVLTQIPAGYYVLMARRKGYVGQMNLQHEHFTTAIVVGPNLDSESLVFPLAPEGVISGEVTDEAGEPIQSARMLLFREDTENGGHAKHLQGQQNTDDEGRYRFGSLRGGNYYLAVSAEPWYARYARFNDSSFRDTAAAQKAGLHTPSLDLVYPITYYPNAIDVSGAAFIRVEAGGSARADMRLVPVPALHMRLQVDELDPQTYRQVSVTQTILGNYQDQASVSTQQIISGRTSENGDGGVGDQSSGPLVMEVDGLRPGASDVQTLDVRGIAPAGVVSGIVRLEGNASPPLGVRVFLRNASKGAGFREDVGSDGNLSFSSDEIEPGVYEVSSAAPGGLELRSVSASGTKVTGRKIEIRNGSDLRLILTLARGVNARVKGIVERGGRPAAGID